jgi:hypothetical protein
MIPDIPGIDVPGIGQFFAQLARMFDSWYTSAVQQTITILLTSSFPRIEDIRSDFFFINFGGMVGLAIYLSSAIAVLLAVAVLIRPRRDHSEKISSWVWSVAGLILYSFLFLRVYSFVDGLSQGVAQASINFITNSENGTVEEITGLLTFTTPGGIGATIFLGWAAALFSYIAAALALVMKLIIVLVLIVYPLLIVLRPLGAFALLAFNAANSLLAVAIISPILMAWVYAGPLFLRNLFPLLESVDIITVLLTFAVSGTAMLIPPLLFIVFFAASSKVFGAIDARGTFAVSSMPPLDINDAQRDIQQVRGTPIRTAITDVVGDKILSGSSVFEDIPRTAVNLGASIAAASGHPYLGAGIKSGYRAIENKIQERKEARETQRNEAGNGTE